MKRKEEITVVFKCAGKYSSDEYLLKTLIKRMVDNMPIEELGKIFSLKITNAMTREDVFLDNLRRQGIILYEVETQIDL